MQDPQLRHMLDRKAVQEVVCALCNVKQPIGLECSSCGVEFGQYSCLMWVKPPTHTPYSTTCSSNAYPRSEDSLFLSKCSCNFFDDDLDKKQYHCTDCGICRVGGRDAFFHCRTCNCCYALALRDSHVCIENSMHQVRGCSSMGVSLTMD